MDLTNYLDGKQLNECVIEKAIIWLQLDASMRSFTWIRAESCSFCVTSNCLQEVYEGKKKRVEITGVWFAWSLILWRTSFFRNRQIFGQNWTNEPQRNAWRCQYVDTSWRGMEQIQINARVRVQNWIYGGFKEGSEKGSEAGETHQIQTQSHVFQFQVCFCFKWRKTTEV